jgi:transposase
MRKWRVRIARQVRFIRLRLDGPEEEMLWQRGKAYSQDLRERVLAAADDGEPVGRIAAFLRVSVSYVSKVLSRRQRTGQMTALPQRCHLPGKLAPLQGAIQARLTTRPDATIAEVQTWLSATHKVSASTGLIWKTLAGLDLTVKKVAARSRAGPSGRCQSAHRMA